MLTKFQKLEAVAWAAKNEGRSYGEFSATLSERRAAAIYEAFEAKLIHDREEEQARLKAAERLHPKKCKAGSVAWELSKQKKSLPLLRHERPE